MTVKEKLMELLSKPVFPHEQADPIEAVADYLLDNGVTIRGSEIWVWNSRELQWECSRCGCIRAHDVILGLDASYCGQCGAEMKGENNE